MPNPCTTVQRRPAPAALHPPAHPCTPHRRPRSKPGKDADAQVLRTCVLLDELVTSERPGGSGGPVVVADVRTIGC